MTNPLADSGDRTEQYGGATRDRTPGKGRYDLISPIFLRDLAVLLEHGAEKYTLRDEHGKVTRTGVRNWERGYSLPLCIDSAERHLNQLKMGLDDEDHALQAAWNLMAFIHVRHLIREGLLPDSLADYVPLHVVNPVTGKVNRGDGPEDEASPWETEDEKARALYMLDIDERPYCARCGAAEENHAPGGSRYGCAFAGAGTEDKCGSCNEVIVWDGECWEAPTLLGGDTVCKGSTRPDVAHEPVGVAPRDITSPRFGQQSTCKGCGESIGWNGTRWVDSLGDAQTAGFCKASKDPDPVHRPSVRPA